MKYALFSLNDTTSADLFAKRLIECGWGIIASSETVALLRSKGLPVQDIADFTDSKVDYGFPPTLSAKVEDALTGSGNKRIDLVYVIPYPLSVGNDVGGRTLLALAVKGGRIAVSSVVDMHRVVSAITETDEVPEDLRLGLSNQICFDIALHYASLITDEKEYDYSFNRFSFDLLNGENPYQIPAAAFSCEAESDPLSLLNFKHISGESPCFTNMADADCILKTICLAAEAFRLNTDSVPYLCVAAKHGNACGMGVSKESAELAIEKALFGNPGAVWGGEVITNFAIDRHLASVLFSSDRRGNLLGDRSWMLDLVMAPYFDSEAISILGKRKRRKLLQNEALQNPTIEKTGYKYRTIRGGFLRQPPVSYILNLKECKIDGNPISENDLQSLIIAWSVAFSSYHGGNEIALAKDGSLFSTGGGPSTDEAAKIAVLRAKACGYSIENTVFAADAFFPFTDAPSTLCNSGATIGCVPRGGRDELNIRQYFRSQGATVAFIPEVFRGFCRH